MQTQTHYVYHTNRDRARAEQRQHGSPCHIKASGLRKIVLKSERRWELRLDGWMEERRGVREEGEGGREEEGRRKEEDLSWS